MRLQIQADNTPNKTQLAGKPAPSYTPGTNTTRASSFLISNTFLPQNFRPKSIRNVFWRQVFHVDIRYCTNIFSANYFLWLSQRTLNNLEKVREVGCRKNSLHFRLTYIRTGPDRRNILKIVKNDLLSLCRQNWCRQITKFDRVRWQKTE